MLQARIPQYMVSTLISEIVSLNKTTDNILEIVKEIINLCILKLEKNNLETEI